MRSTEWARYMGLCSLPMLFLLVPPCAAQTAVIPPVSEKASVDIVESLRASGKHHILAAALKASDLAEHISAIGPMTFFAPTDRAFENMPSERRRTLLLPENIDRLRKVLSYHLVSGTFTAADLTEAVRLRHGRTSLRTMTGAPLHVSTEGDSLIITDHEGGQARVLQQSVAFSEGTIHVVDAVLIPRDIERGFTPYL